MSSNNRVILQNPFCIIKELDRYKILFPDDSADGGKFFYIAVSNALELYGGLSVYMMMPAAIGIILVCPAGQYHNILVFLQVVLIFYTSQRRYIWEGVHKESYEEDKNEENVEG